MEADQWRQVEQLFQSARAVPPDEREVFLREHCDDPAVREEVSSLFSAREEAPAFFEAAARGGVAPALEAFEAEGGGDGEAPDLTGQTVGPYRLVEEIGVGGMGVVYRAERTGADFDQTVAVKLLQRRLHATEAADRFRAERQMLARLDHPKIAHLIDGGVTDGGRPYLVMEHVEGVPITDYAEAHELDLETRLDLLEQVCEVVEAAHRQLVVHRDLKPSNVLVTETEDGPRVKLLDFGIAKLLDDSMPVTRLQTRTGQQLMTPAYAAPEQVTGDEITTETDVYQLGVLAYELLAGARPFDLADKPLTEIERILLEETPEPPSARGGAEGARLEGDLDTMVLKALRKEPGRRYRSVEALATDLRRHRQGEPVEARPATFGYRAKKFVMRNKTGIAVAAGFLAVIAVAGALLVHQRNRAEQKAERARAEAETARQVSTVLVDLFEIADPYGETDTLTAQTLLRRSERRLARLQGRPALRARLLGGLGRVYRGFGEYGTADSLHEKALHLRRRIHDGPHPGVATSLHNLGWARHERGRYAVAESLATEALAMRRQLYEPPHPKIAQSLYRLAAASRQQEEMAAADSLMRAALSMQRTVYDRPDPRIARTLNDLGLILEEQEEYPAADSAFRRALSIRRQTLGPLHPRTAETLNDYGLLHKEMRNYAMADSLYRRALEIRTQALGPKHPNNAVTLFNLGRLREDQGRYQAAKERYRATISIEREKLGRHPTTAISLGYLADLQEDRGRYAAADSLYREALSIERETLGPTHPSTVDTMDDLAAVLRKRKQYAAADSLYRMVLALRRENQGPKDPETAATLNNYGLLLKKAGNYVAADSMYRQSLAIKREILEPGAPGIATTIHNRAYVLMVQGEYTAAGSLFHQALRMRRANDGENSLVFAQTKNGMALLALRRERYRTAERHGRAALRIRRRHLRDGHPLVRESERHLARIYEAWGRPKQARQYRIAEGSRSRGTEK